MPAFPTTVHMHSSAWSGLSTRLKIVSLSTKQFEVVVVPAVERLLRKKQARLGVDRLMPWDWVPDMGNIVVSTIDGPPQAVSRAGRIDRRLFVHVSPA